MKIEFERQNTVDELNMVGTYAVNESGCANTCNYSCLSGGLSANLGCTNISCK